MISKKALDEYKQIYREQFGEDISDEEALDQAINLLTLMDKIYRPIKKDWLNESEKKDANNMPQVSKECVLELQRIIKEEYGKNIPFEEAGEIARNLVGCFDLLAKMDYKSTNLKVKVPKTAKAKSWQKIPDLLIQK